MKPTYGAISRSGVFPLAPSLDQVGPMTRTVRDNALLFDACTGRDPADPTSLGLPGPVTPGIGDGVAGLRIALLEEFNAPAEPIVQEALARAVAALRDLGAEVVPVATPPIEAFNDCARLLLQAESYTAHRRTLSERADDYGWRARTKLLCGAFVDAASYIDAQRERRGLSAALHAALDGYAAALCVSSFHLPARIDDDEAVDRTYDRQARIAFNLTGGPAISLPTALSEDGLPTGVQIAGRPGQDATVYRVAAALEAGIGAAWLRGVTPPWRSA
jgi:aspartyl-tRNA(Asn)/glutamyl-tRNA(Gln) amidotransferase subunit A